jgi:AcrR family transcriptional regulator
MQQSRLALAAGVPVSSIYHHFGSMEQLFLTAQDHARREAERWCAAQIDAISGIGAMSPAGFAAYTAALIDNWSHEHRRLAFAWRQCHLLAGRDQNYAPALNAWRAMWGAFWADLSALCGLDAFGEPAYFLFDGESLLHLMRWRRTVDRACVEELCQGWGMWLSGSLAPEGPWRGFARDAAERTMPRLPSLSGTVEQIALAAADFVEQHGMAGLTHRAVAGRAGLTLGVVSHNFRTSADLARAAFEMIYRRIAPSGDAAQPKVTNAREAMEWIRADRGDAARMLAMDELFLTVARDPALQSFAPQLRYLRGRTSGASLQAIVGADRPVSPLDAALYSGFVSGQRRAMLGLSADEAEPQIKRTYDFLFRTLGVA